MHLRCSRWDGQVGWKSMKGTLVTPFDIESCSLRNSYVSIQSVSLQCSLCGNPGHSLHCFVMQKCGHPPNILALQSPWCWARGRWGGVSIVGRIGIYVLHSLACYIPEMCAIRRPKATPNDYRPLAVGVIFQIFQHTGRHLGGPVLQDDRQAERSSTHCKRSI
jgi:hypothetical protein